MSADKKEVKKEVVEKKVEKKESPKKEEKPAAEEKAKLPLGASVVEEKPSKKRNSRKPGADGISVAGHQKLPPKEEPKPKQEKTEGKKDDKKEDKKGDKKAEKKPKKDDDGKKEEKSEEVKKTDKKETKPKKEGKKPKKEDEEKQSEKPEEKKEDKKDEAPKKMTLAEKKAAVKKALNSKPVAPTKTAGAKSDEAIADPAIVASGPKKAPKKAWDNKPQQPAQDNKKPKSHSPTNSTPPATHNVKLLCVMHGQMRYVNQMSRRPDGTYVCNDDKACRPEFAPAHERNAASQQQQQRPPRENNRQQDSRQQHDKRQPRQHNPNHNVKALCYYHNQMRYVNALTLQENGKYRCNPEKECQPEYANFSSPEAISRRESQNQRHDQPRQPRQQRKENGAEGSNPYNKATSGAQAGGFW